jgi:hypothetical protein
MNARVWVVADHSHSSFTDRHRPDLGNPITQQGAASIFNLLRGQVAQTRRRVGQTLADNDPTNPLGGSGLRADAMKGRGLRPS